MQYETIILELMSRIKALENEVEVMKKDIQSLQAARSQSEANDLSDSSDTAAQITAQYSKTTDQMIDACYSFGKIANNNNRGNIGGYANVVSSQTGMNRNSAFMYICAVDCLLGGKVFKRAISTKALRKYLSSIYGEFGKTGLEKAIKATRAHIAYRHENGLPSDSISALCDEFENML